MSAPTATVTPALAPPAGVTPNFVDPPSLQPVLVGPFVVILVLTTTTTVVRLYTRLFIIRIYGWQDYLMFIAQLAFLAYLSVVYNLFNFGAGVDEWNVPDSKMGGYRYWGYIEQVLRGPTMLPLKLSIYLQFRHLFVVKQGPRLWCIQILIWTTSAFYFAGTIVSILKCYPVQASFDTEVSGRCVDLPLFTLLLSSFNVISDLLTVAFPVWCVWDLRILARQKVQLSALFLLGTTAVIFGILRMAFYAVHIRSNNTTYGQTQVVWCGVGEICNGIIASNLIVFPRMVRYLRTRWRGVGDSDHSGNGTADTTKVSGSLAQTAIGQKGYGELQDRDSLTDVEAQQGIASKRSSRLYQPPRRFEIPRREGSKRDRLRPDLQRRMVVESQLADVEDGRAASSILESAAPPGMRVGGDGDGDGDSGREAANKEHSDGASEDEDASERTAPTGDDRFELAVFRTLRID